MAARRTRQRTAVLGVLYVLATAAIITGGVCLFRGCYLAWVLCLFGGIEGLVWAYRLRTGHGPYRLPGSTSK
jgi:thiosulfate reductase cytochrome b subunit